MLVIVPGRGAPHGAPAERKDHQLLLPFDIPGALFSHRNGPQLIALAQGGFTVPAYAAAKGALGQLTKALSNEWSKENVQVNGIVPGYIATEMFVFYRLSFSACPFLIGIFPILGTKNSLRTQYACDRFPNAFQQGDGATRKTSPALYCSLRARRASTYAASCWS